MNRKHIVIAAMTALATFAASGEETITKAARKVFAAKSDSVVWVTAISKMTIRTSGVSGARPNVPDQERKVETTATVIDSSGLVVASLSAVDPSAAVDGKEVETPMGTVTINASSKTKEVKILMPDGTELPADIVMKDPDLDLVFIRAKADSKEYKDVKFQTVDLKDSAKSAVLDEVIVLGRTGETFNRQPSVITSLITAEMKKPRAFYRIPADGVGTPVFYADGKVLGIMVLRQNKGSESANTANVSMAPAMLPANEVAEIAAQALKAKPIATEDTTDEKGPKDDEKSK